MCMYIHTNTHTQTHTHTLQCDLPEEPNFISQELRIELRDPSCSVLSICAKNFLKPQLGNLWHFNIPSETDKIHLLQMSE